jgi:F-type H+-transporting ATPase subunit delta
LPALDPAAKRYALAAFAVAQERNDLEGWQEAITQIADLMSMPEVRAALENSRVPFNSKVAVIEQSLPGLSPLQINLAKVMVQKRRVELARQVADQFTELVEETRGVVRATARTAVPLSDGEHTALLQRLQEQTGRRVILTTDVDPTLLGGVVVQIGDQLIDASTRSRLDSLRDQLVGAI